MDATDAASRALSRVIHPSKPQTYTALSEEGNVPRATLWHRAHGRPSKEEAAAKQQYLSPQEEKALADYLLRMSYNGFPIPYKHVPFIAVVIVRQRSSIFQTPASDETLKPPGKKWCQLFFKRHPEVHPSRRKALDWKRHDNNIFNKMTHWFEVIGKELHDPVIESGNVYNMDETGTMLCKLNTIKVVVGKDDLRRHRGAEVNREQISTIECISGDGKLLDPMIIWPASSHRAKWTTYRTPGWHYAYSDSGYTDSVISFEWLKCVFDPQTKARAQQKPRILIVDGFKSHETIEAIQYCLENNIILCRIPSHTSHKLQPCDVGVFSPLKTAYRELVERLYRGGAAKVGKEHFTSLYSRAREVAFTSRNIRAGWAKSGLIPFNPDRVLSETPKPPDEPSVLKQEVTVVSRLKDVPHTPVTSDALTSLCSLVEQHTDGLDERGKHHVEKLRNAAKKWAAECAILLDENKLLFEQNNESNVRKSTRSTVVGKAKVMSWEELEKAKAARTAKEQATVGKGKKTRGRKPKNPAPEGEEVTVGKKTRGRKRKRPTSEADTTEPAQAKVARVSDTLEPKAPVAWMSEAQDPARASIMRLTEAQELATQAFTARLTEAQTAEDEIARGGMEDYCSVFLLGSV